MNKIELREKENGGFYLHLRLSVGPGQIGMGLEEMEFETTCPDTMTRKNAETKLFQLSEKFGLDREDFPVSSSEKLPKGYIR